MVNFIVKLVLSLLGPARLTLDKNHPIRPVGFDGAKLTLDVVGVDYRFKNVPCKVTIDLFEGVATLTAEDSLNHIVRDHSMAKIEVGEVKKINLYSPETVGKNSVPRVHSLSSEDDDILGND